MGYIAVNPMPGTIPIRSLLWDDHGLICGANLVNDGRITITFRNTLRSVLTVCYGSHGLFSSTTHRFKIVILGVVWISWGDMRGIWNQQKLNDSCQKKVNTLEIRIPSIIFYQNCHIGLSEVRPTSYVSLKAIEIQPLLDMLDYIYRYTTVVCLFGF